MSKAARLATRIEALEAEYRLHLIEALEACAAGRWGLFGHNEHLDYPTAQLQEVTILLDLGGAINQLRGKLGEPNFDLHERFVAARGRAGENELGEPKKAQAWLAQLRAT